MGLLLQKESVHDSTVIASGAIHSSVPFSDRVTMTTNESLHGRRPAMILYWRGVRRTVAISMGQLYRPVALRVRQFPRLTMSIARPASSHSHFISWSLPPGCPRGPPFSRLSYFKVLRFGSAVVGYISITSRSSNHCMTWSK